LSPPVYSVVTVVYIFTPLAMHILKLLYLISEKKLDLNMDISIYHSNGNTTRFKQSKCLVSNRDGSKRKGGSKISWADILFVDERNLRILGGVLVQDFKGF
jgi:hypothetical protein